MRFRLFEFEDKIWLPDIIRKGMLDYLRFVLNTGNFYAPVSPIIIDVLKKTNSLQVIDLCSGGGGTIDQIQKSVHEQYNQRVTFILTDIFPNIEAYKFIKRKTGGYVNYIPLPVNAASVPTTLKGIRTIFSAFHHFNKHTALEVLQDAVAANEGIAIFDGGNKNLFFIIIISLLHPVAFILGTPFLKPFKWSRLLFTYVIPVIPLCTIWDGIVSILRLYSPKELLAMASNINNNNFHWQAGKVKNKYGMHISYLIGYPIK